MTTFSMRWSLCWYRQAAVNRPDAGSIPAAAADDSERVVRIDLKEVIRPDEGPVLKTGGEHDSLVGSSPMASAL
jgi:hypothetical protein